MKKSKSNIEGKLFDRLIIECANIVTPYFQKTEQVQTAILYQVFFYSLLESGILYSRENLSTPEAKILFKDYPLQFTVNDTENLLQFFIPELYGKISEFILGNLPELPVYLLGGFFYENLLARLLIENPEASSFDVIYDKQVRKNNGIFYTPLQTAENFIKGLFEHLNVQDKDLSEFRILDLACGCGVFSIISLNLFSDLVVARLDQENNSISNNESSRDRTQILNRRNQSTITRLSLLKNNIFGVDNDETALEITRYSLLLFSLYAEKNIISISQFSRMCTTLKNNFQKQDIIEAYKKESFENHYFGDKKFDMVVTNPPYIAYYSRHSKADTGFHKNLPLMKQNLIHTMGIENNKKKSGRLNSIMFFLNYAFRYLSPEAYLALVVDMNIHESLFFDMRNWMLKNLTLLETRINVYDFPGVNSGQSFIYLHNIKPAKINYVKIINQKNNESELISQDALKKYSSFYIRKNSELLEHLEHLPLLGECCRISSGVNIGGASEYFLSNHDGGGVFYPMMTPLQLKHPYSPIKSNSDIFIDFNKEKAVATNRKSREMNKNNVIALGKLERFLKPKIFVRQSAPRIIAAYSEEAVVSPYSVFVINEYDDNNSSNTTGYNLFVLLAILNSDLISYYCVKKGFIRQGSGKQPQIRKSSLQLIPVPNIENYIRLKSDLEKYVKQLISITDSSNHDKFFDSDGLVEKIEKYVCLLYEVDHDAFKAEKDLLLFK